VEKIGKKNRVAGGKKNAGPGANPGPAVVTAQEKASDDEGVTGGLKPGRGACRR
jgi:hypothetical protein